MESRMKNYNFIQVLLIALIPAIVAGIISGVVGFDKSVTKSETDIAVMNASLGAHFKYDDQRFEDIEKQRATQYAALKERIDEVSEDLKIKKNIDRYSQVLYGDTTSTGIWLEVRGVEMDSTDFYRHQADSLYYEIIASLDCIKNSVSQMKGI
jgi:hypothetical protein